MTRTVLLATLVLGTVTAPASAAIFTVNSVVDAVDAAIDGVCAAANGTCTLRAAVQEANANAEADVVNVPAGKYTLKLVGAGEDGAATGDLDLLGDVEVVGAGPKLTVIKGKKDRVVHVGPGATVRLANLTVSNGKLGKKGQIGDAFNGGGILSDNAALTLENVVVAKNAASDDGGGIAALDGSLTLTDVLVAGNKAGDDAGGIDLDSADGTLTNVTLSKNKSKDDSGGMEIEGSGTVTLTNCTLSGNAGAEKGGGFGCEGGGTASLLNVTVKGNKVKVGGAVENDGTCSVTIQNTLLDKNKPAGCAGAIMLAGGNLESGATCGLGGGSQNLKLKVAGLNQKKNGGATPTHALKEGSPAIDQGAGCPPTDQRGAPRAGACDTGAFEFQPAP